MEPIEIWMAEFATVGGEGRTVTADLNLRHNFEMHGFSVRVEKSSGQYYIDTIVVADGVTLTSADCGPDGSCFTLSSEPGTVWDATDEVFSTIATVTYRLADTCECNQTCRDWVYLTADSVWDADGYQRYSVATDSALLWMTSETAIADSCPGLQVGLTDGIAPTTSMAGEIPGVSLGVVFGAGGELLPGVLLTGVDADILYDPDQLTLDTVLPANWIGRLEYTEPTTGVCRIHLWCEQEDQCRYSALPTILQDLVTVKFSGTCATGNNAAVCRIGSDTRFYVDGFPYTPISAASCPECWEEATVTIVAPGDLTGDCNRNLADITDMIGSVYLGKILDPMAGLAADVTCDGRCTLDDITRLIDYIYLNGAELGCP